MTGFMLRIYMLVISVLTSGIALGEEPTSLQSFSDVTIGQHCSVEQRQTAFFIVLPSTGKAFEAHKNAIPHDFISLDIIDVMLAYQQSVLTQLYDRKMVLLSVKPVYDFLRYRLSHDAQDQDNILIS